MELFTLYSKLIACSILGMAFQIYFKNRSLQHTAIKADVDYSIWYFIKKDKNSIIGTFLTMCLFFILFGEVINSVSKNSSAELKPYLWGFIMLSGKMIANILVMLICVTVAYTGQDVALRVLGRTSQELKNALESKIPGQK